MKLAEWEIAIVVVIVAIIVYSLYGSFTWSQLRAQAIATLPPSNLTQVD